MSEMSSFSRALPISGASNFRDLGHYLNAEGRRVRTGSLFRSDNLAGLDAQDQERIRQLGITRSFDFRGVQEREASRYELPGVQQHHLPIEPTVVQGIQSILEAGRSMTAGDTVDLMQQTYRDFVYHNSDRFADLFGHILREDQPLVFHCTAGKDRTGLAAALILLALDVPMDTVMQDYLLTNQLYRMPDANEERRVPQEVLNVLWRVQADFLHAAFQVIDAEYGSVDAYLTERLGLRPDAREHLQHTYLVGEAKR